MRRRARTVHPCDRGVRGTAALFLIHLPLPLSPPVVQGVVSVWPLYWAFAVAMAIALVRTETKWLCDWWDPPEPSSVCRIRVTDTGCLMAPLYGRRRRGMPVSLKTAALEIVRAAFKDMRRFRDVHKHVYVIDGAALKQQKRTFVSVVSKDQLVARHQDMDRLRNSLNDAVRGTRHEHRVQFVLAPGDAEDWVKYVVSELNLNKNNRAVAVGLDSDLFMSEHLAFFLHRKQSSWTPETWCSQEVLLAGFNEKARESKSLEAYKTSAAWEVEGGLIKAKHLALIALLAGDDYTIEGGGIGLVSAIVNVAKVLLQVGGAKKLDPSRASLERVRDVLDSPLFPLTAEKAVKAKAAWEAESESEGALQGRLDSSGERMAALRADCNRTNPTVRDIELRLHGDTAGTPAVTASAANEGLLRCRVSVPVFPESRAGGAGGGGSAEAVAAAPQDNAPLPDDVLTTWEASVRRNPDLGEILFFDINKYPDTLHPDLIGLRGCVEDAGVDMASRLATERAEAALLQAGSAAPAGAGAGASQGSARLNLAGAFDLAVPGDRLIVQVVCDAPDVAEVVRAMEEAMNIFVREKAEEEVEVLLAQAWVTPVEDHGFWQVLLSCMLYLARGRPVGSATGEGGGALTVGLRVGDDVVNVSINAAEKGNVDIAMGRFKDIYAAAKQRAATAERAAFAELLPRAVRGRLPAHDPGWGGIAHLLPVVARGRWIRGSAGETTSTLNFALLPAQRHSFNVTAAERPGVQAAVDELQAVYEATAGRAAKKRAATAERAALAELLPLAVRGRLPAHHPGWGSIAHLLPVVARGRWIRESAGETTSNVSFALPPAQDHNVKVTAAERPGVQAAMDELKAVYEATAGRAAKQRAATAERAALAELLPLAVRGRLPAHDPGWGSIAHLLPMVARGRWIRESPGETTSNVGFNLLPAQRHTVKVTAAERPGVQAAVDELKAVYEATTGGAAAARAAAPPPPPAELRRGRSGRNV
jgi:hypothetical protein